MGISRPPLRIESDAATNQLVREGGRALVLVNAPSSYVEDLRRAVPGIRLTSAVVSPVAAVHLFPKSRREFEWLLRAYAPLLAHDAAIWAAWPSGAPLLAPKLTAIGAEWGWSELCKITSDRWRGCVFLRAAPAPRVSRKHASSVSLLRLGAGSHAGTPLENGSSSAWPPQHAKTKSSSAGVTGISGEQDVGFCSDIAGSAS
jgi:hypothetical protein